MTDNYQQIPPYQAPPPPPPAKKSNRTIVIIAIVVGALCLCTIVCIAAFALLGNSLFGIDSITSSQQAPVEDVLISYMNAMESRDVEGAYALFSPRSQRQFPSSDLNGLIEGDNYLLFEGFKSLTIDNSEISYEANLDQDVPQGTVATVSGSIIYGGGFEGSIEAVLEEVDGAWRIHNVTVTIP